MWNLSKHNVHSYFCNMADYSGKVPGYHNSIQRLINSQNYVCLSIPRRYPDIYILTQLFWSWNRKKKLKWSLLSLYLFTSISWSKKLSEYIHVWVSSWYPQTHIVLWIDEFLDTIMVPGYLTRIICHIMIVLKDSTHVACTLSRTKTLSITSN